jgi:hypothetical protein
VRIKSAYNNANNFCLKNGMQLYKVQSPAATSVISVFTKKVFGGSSRAVAFVEGKTGKKCKTFSGTGKTNLDSCQTTYSFFCEFIDQGNSTCYNDFVT